jgi:inner membrane protein
MWRTVAENNEHRLIEIRGSVLDSRLPEYRYLTQYDNAQTLRTNLPAQSRPYAQRLDWFSGHWTGYRVQMLPATSTTGDAAEQLVVDDLRMMAGDTAFFSFVLAEKANQHAQWQAITPIEAPIITVDNEPTPSRFELIQQGFKRVFDESMIDRDNGWKVVE